jgi:type II secretory pathway pseudopilin PulG
MKRTILIIIIVIILAAVAVYLYVFRKTEASVASREADYSVTANDLVNAFETDENAANVKYLDKVVKVQGTVAEINENNNEISVILREPGTTSGVTCSFDESALKKDRLKSGQKVFIKGICTGYLMDVVLNRCALDIEPAK